MSSMGVFGGLTSILSLLLFVAFIFGSVLARRGEKSWRTMMMLIGSSAQGLGVVMYFGGAVFMMTSFRGGSSAGSIADSASVMMGIMAIAGLLILGGMIAFAIAFVAYCARAGAAAKRAGELEVMLGHLQQRLTELEGTPGPDGSAS